jgi:curved DNA-binding protein CbpA
MAPPSTTDDFYKILEVEQDASVELIVRSNKRLALQLHPDKNSGHNATQGFQRVR